MGKKAGLTHTVLQITSADFIRLFESINQLGIAVFDVNYLDDLTAQVSIHSGDVKAVLDIVSKRGESYKFIKKGKQNYVLTAIKQRKFFICGLIFLLAIALFVPTRVYFVRIEGNKNVPAKQILQQAEQCGIHFGASRRALRSEKVKNALLQRIPQLQWAGINTAGCVATISVREKDKKENAESDRYGVSSLVAVRDGIVQQLTVTDGQAMCRIGQAVKAGQTLISGYTDCGIVIKAVKAEGEIYAQTAHSLTAITPTEYTYRGDENRKQVRYNLIVGKKLIKLWKDSGISDTSCVKMYSVKRLTLPGGFQLPLALQKQTQISYHTVSKTDKHHNWLHRFAEQYLKSQMIAGTVEHSDTQLWESDGIAGLRGSFVCTEMIGRTKAEELLQGDNKSG